MVVVLNVTSDRVMSEEDLMAPLEETCWVSEMWNNSPNQDVMNGIFLPEHNGWYLTPSNSYAIAWVSPEIEEQVKNSINFLVKGCSCKKNKCKISSAAVATEAETADLAVNVMGT